MRTLSIQLLLATVVCLAANSLAPAQAVEQWRTLKAADTSSNLQVTVAAGATHQLIALTRQRTVLGTTYSPTGASDQLIITYNAAGDVTGAMKISSTVGGLTLSRFKDLPGQGLVVAGNYTGAGSFGGVALAAPATTRSGFVALISYNLAVQWANPVAVSGQVTTLVDVSNRATGGAYALINSLQGGVYQSRLISFSAAGAQTASQVLPLPNYNATYSALGTLPDGNLITAVTKPGYHQSGGSSYAGYTVVASYTPALAQRWADTINGFVDYNGYSWSDPQVSNIITTEDGKAAFDIRTGYYGSTGTQGVQLVNGANGAYLSSTGGGYTQINSFCALPAGRVAVAYNQTSPGYSYINIISATGILKSYQVAGNSAYYGGSQTSVYALSSNASGLLVAGGTSSIYGYYNPLEVNLENLHVSNAPYFIATYSACTPPQVSISVSGQTATASVQGSSLYEWFREGFVQCAYNTRSIMANYPGYYSVKAEQNQCYATSAEVRVLIRPPLPIPRAAG